MGRIILAIKKHSISLRIVVIVFVISLGALRL